MSTDLRDRLRRLGVHKGAANVTPKPKRKSHLESLITGEVIETDYGPTFIHTERYAPDHVHGLRPLRELLDLPGSIAARLAGLDPEEMNLRRTVFIDTETTGLSGGTGTLAFVVGVGMFDDEDRFKLHQYFLRNPNEEAAMLLHLSETLDQYTSLVSFNGRGFDLPLLQTRFTLARMRPKILTAPHLDLLPPARRVWKGRYESCSLSTLEYHVLQVQREQADVSGALIPQMYFDYQRSGDASEMPRVMYHNALDILSMVSLSTHLIQLLARSTEAIEDSADLFALGKWAADRGELDRAELLLRQAIDRSDDLKIKNEARSRLASIYKQLDRRDQAIEVWQELAQHPASHRIDLSITACIELAKHFEWQAIDLKRAIKWTQRGLKLAEDFPDQLLLQELRHRSDRLERKLQK
ncbi:MAG TPA: ribonuclease H-like domain-containing protein [Anaerolineae bacterium]|nr:ribonuclease H-like domain-containing protein [Anaerolineae bacterium]